MSETLYLQIDYLYYNVCSNISSVSSPHRNFKVQNVIGR